MYEYEKCPFCKSNNIMGISSSGGLLNYEECRDCGAHGPFKETAELSFEAWNQCAQPKKGKDND